MEEIRQARAVLGVTQTELAKMLGLNQSTVSRLERGSLALDSRTKLALEALQARSAVPTKAAA